MQVKELLNLLTEVESLLLPGDIKDAALELFNQVEMIRCDILKTNGELSFPIAEEIKSRSKKLGRAVIRVSTEFCVARIFSIPEQIQERRIAELDPEFLKSQTLDFRQTLVDLVPEFMSYDGADNGRIIVEQEITARQVDRVA